MTKNWHTTQQYYSAFPLHLLFLASMYSESLFALLTFYGALLFVEKKYYMALLPWTASTLVRSNGLLLSGFYLYEALKLYRSPLRALKLLLLAPVLWAGIVAFQGYGYWAFCMTDPASTPPRPWCNSRVPLLYSFVQSHYWNNGFLRYWTLQQLPNFLLAGPMLVLSVCGWGLYLWQADMPLLLFGSSGRNMDQSKSTEDGSRSSMDNYGSKSMDNDRNRYADKGRSASLGIGSGNLNVVGVRTRAAAAAATMRKASHQEKSISAPSNLSPRLPLPAQASGYFSASAFPFHVLWLVLTVYTVFFMHVQVVTRLFTSMPGVYWFAAYCLDRSERSRWMVLGYFVGYGLVTLVLFSNFYPPA